MKKRAEAPAFRASLIILLELDGPTLIGKPMVLYADELLDVTPELLRIYDRVPGILPA